MNTATSIQALPVDPAAISGIGSGMSLHATQPPIMHHGGHEQHPGMGGGGGGGGGGPEQFPSQDTLNQLIMGVQQANAAGATRLHHRDVQSSGPQQHDPNIRTDYIPGQPMPPNMLPPGSGLPPPMPANYPHIGGIPASYYPNSAGAGAGWGGAPSQTFFDTMYTEIHIPLLIAGLYFLFQLPFFRQLLNSYTPMLFSSDGNMNITGYVFTSVLFGMIFHGLVKFCNS